MTNDEAQIQKLNKIHDACILRADTSVYAQAPNDVYLWLRTAREACAMASELKHKDD